MKDNSIKLVILGFASILMLMFLLVFISQHQLRKNNQTLSSLITDTNVKIQMANSMRDAVRARAILIHKIQLTNDFFEKDALYMDFINFSGTYKEARRKLLATSLNDKERAAIERLDRIAEIAQPINDRTVENLLHNQNMEETRLNLKKSKTLQEATLKVLDSLVEMENQTAYQASITANQHYKNTTIIFYTLTFISVLVCISIIWLVTRNVQRVNKQITYQATHDDLTGLVNRYEFENRVQAAMQRSIIDQSQHALLFMDLDQFKIINDTCGHLAGDRLLQKIPDLIHTCIRQHDTLSRLGGDEFGVLLENCDTEQAVFVAEEIREKILNFQFLWQDKKFFIGISIGITAINAQTQNIQQAFSCADAACYIAKENGRNLVHIFNDNDQSVIQQQSDFYWISQLSESSNTNNFQIYFQPIVSLKSDKQQHPEVYYEALLRHIDQKGQIQTPDKFLPAAERFGKMPLIDRWVITSAIKQFAEKTSDDKHSKLSINLSGRSMNNEKLLDHIESVFKEYHFPPERLCFEITETEVIASMDDAIRLMKKIKNMGCQFALDDFGSGLSSFCYLKNLPVDILKIDGEFIKNIASDPIDKALVESIHHVGKIMNIKTVAECVESETVIQILKSIGIDYVQGYAISKPLPSLPKESNKHYIR